MADTQRTSAAILAILADNATGDISAQDMRDTFVTTSPDHAELYVSTAAATTVSVKDTWYPISGTWTLSAGAKNFTESVNGQLLFGGDATRHFLISSAVSMSGGNGDTLEFGIGIDGTIWTPSIIRRKLGSVDVGAAAVSALVSLAAGSYVVLMGRNTSNTTNFTVNLSNLSVMGMVA